jgi:hypothetical protein
MPFGFSMGRSKRQKAEKEFLAMQTQIASLQE